MRYSHISSPFKLKHTTFELVSHAMISKSPSLFTSATITWAKIESIINGNAPFGLSPFLFELIWKRFTFVINEVNEANPSSDKNF